MALTKPAWIRFEVWKPKTWVPKGKVVTDRHFEHASIPATVTNWLNTDAVNRSEREKAADTFLDLLTVNAARDDAPEFDLG